MTKKANKPATQDQASHLVNYQSHGETLYIYGDGLVCTDPKKALRFTKADAEAYIAARNRTTNSLRLAGGLKPLTFKIEEA